MDYQSVFPFDKELKENINMENIQFDINDPFLPKPTACPQRMSFPYLNLNLNSLRKWSNHHL